MPDMNEEMASLMAAMEETDSGTSKDDVDVLLASGEKEGTEGVRGRAERERAKKKDEESGAVRVLKRVLPIVGAGIGALLLGLVLGAVMFGGDDSEQKVVHEIDAVNLKAPILEQLDSVKDAQIRSLEKQLVELNATVANDDETRSAAAVAFRNVGRTTNAVNGLLDAAIALSPTASDNEVRIAVDQVAQYMTASGVATTPYKLMTGPSPAKELNKNVRKASRATMTLSGMSADASMLVITAYVPVMAEDSTIHEAVYVILTDLDKVESCEYIGMWTPGAGVNVDGALENAYTALAASKTNVYGQVHVDDAVEGEPETLDAGAGDNASAGENAESGDAAQTDKPDGEPAADKAVDGNEEAPADGETQE